MFGYRRVQAYKKYGIKLSIFIMVQPLHDQNCITRVYFKVIVTQPNSLSPLPSISLSVCRLSDGVAPAYDSSSDHQINCDRFSIGRDRDTDTWIYQFFFLRIIYMRHQSSSSRCEHVTVSHENRFFCERFAIDNCSICTSSEVHEDAIYLSISLAGLMPRTTYELRPRICRLRELMNKSSGIEVI